MSPAELIKHYPQLYHMAEAHTWPSIRQHGLLSTTALLDLFEIDGPARHAIESTRRATSIQIEHPLYGTAVIRDQIPLRENALTDCLSGMTPQEWYETLNRRVFFWLTRDRLLKLLSAKAYRDREHCVIIVDTGRLVRRHLRRVTLSPINSGSTLYKPQARGQATFLSVKEYPFEERRKSRSVENAVAELSVHYSVPDIAQVALRVEHMIGPRLVELVYEE